VGGWDVACCDDKKAALAFDRLAVIVPADGWLDDVKICVDDEPGDCIVEDVDA
jgi:hypothetical protein